MRTPVSEQSKNSQNREISVALIVLTQVFRKVEWRCGPAMSAGKKEDGGKAAKRTATKSASMATATISEVKQGGQGRVKDPGRDKRLARNRHGPTGQGRVKDRGSDRRLAQNRPGPTGQGRVKNPKEDRRLSANREGPTGQGRVKDPKHDRRLSENRPGPTGQGRVKDPARDKRLRDNRS